MHIATVSPEIASLLHDKRWGALARYRAWPETETIAPELADALLKLNPADRALLFRRCPRRSPPRSSVASRASLAMRYCASSPITKRASCLMK